MNRTAALAFALDLFAIMSEGEDDPRSPFIDGIRNGEKMEAIRHLLDDESRTGKEHADRTVCRLIASIAVGECFIYNAKRELERYRADEPDDLVGIERRHRAHEDAVQRYGDLDYLLNRLTMSAYRYGPNQHLVRDTPDARTLGLAAAAAADSPYYIECAIDSDSRPLKAYQYYRVYQVLAKHPPPSP